MPRRRSDPAISDEQRIQDLFTTPPVGQAELAGRLAGGDKARCRKLLVERLRAGSVSPAHGDLVVEAFRCLGLGDERASLLDLAVDVRVDVNLRANVIGLLLILDPSVANELQAHLSPEDVMRIADRPLAGLLAEIQSTPEMAESLPRMIEATPKEHRESLIARIEQLRKQSGTSALAAYGPALKHPEIQRLLGLFLAAIVEEGAPGAAAFLKRLRERATDDRTRRDLQAALLRVRTRAIEPREKPVPDGFAIISNCDGQGAFIVLGCIVNPDRSLTLADLCIRAAADIRDGFVNSGCTQAEVEELLNEMRSQNLHFTRAPLRPVAALVRAAAERTRAMGVKIPRDAKVAMAQWERIPPESTDLPAPLGRRATTEEVEALLDRPGYGSWFFDEGDLGGAGVSPPGARQSVERWAAKAALALARQEPIRQRVVAMCEHMARWHAFAGDTDAAHLCATLTVEVKEDFKNSALVTSMAARVLRPDASEPQRSRRPYIKQHFFADVKKPTGRDLAILDFTEAADTALDRVMTSLPGESRPRDEQLLDAAHGIGRTFAAYILAPRKSEMGALIRELSDVLAKSTRLTPREQQQIAVLTLQQLAGFVDEVCGQCPVGCLDRPRMNAAAPFFAPGHPVLK